MSVSIPIRPDDVWFFDVKLNITFFNSPDGMPGGAESVSERGMLPTTFL